MKKSDKKLVYKACELLANYDEVCSCGALAEANFSRSFYLRNKFKKFCGSPSSLTWFDDIAEANERRSARILALCFFAQCSEDVL